MENEKILAMCLLIILTQVTMAGKNTPMTKIIFIYTYANYAVVRIANKTVNVDSCTHGRATKYLRINYSETGGKEMYSAALAAFMSDSKVRLGHSGCVSWGKTIPKVYRVDVLK